MLIAAASIQLNRPTTTHTSCLRAPSDLLAPVAHIHRPRFRVYERPTPEYRRIQASPRKSAVHSIKNGSKVCSGSGTIRTMVHSDHSGRHKTSASIGSSSDSRCLCSTLKQTLCAHLRINCYTFRPPTPTSLCYCSFSIVSQPPIQLLDCMSPEF